MRGGFGTEAVDDADDEDGAAVITEGEGVGPGGVGVGEAADAPGGVACSADKEGNAAARDVVMMIRGFTTEEAEEDVDGEDDEGGANEALADCVHVMGEREVEEDNSRTEEGDRESVAESVEKPKPHAFAPGALNAGDV